MNKFRYSSCTYAPLNQNGFHQFAANHALVHYSSGAICTYIPKNACSTLRLSLAIANGCIQGVDDHNWIHNNNGTFVAGLPELIRAPYSFVFIRCPFARLASAYLDKIVEHTPEAWQLLEYSQRKYSLNDLTFEKFVSILCDPVMMHVNDHWRRQVDFLVYSEYSDVFNVADIKNAAEIVLSKCGLKLEDARKFSRHGRDQFISDENFSAPYRVSPFQLLQEKRLGRLPAIHSLYNSELRAIVAEIYAVDIALFKLHCGSDSLTFPGY